MRIVNLKKFNFYIGNTIEGEDIVATNNGIEGDDGIIGEYSDCGVYTAEDFVDGIEDAIMNSDLDVENTNGLLEVFGDHVASEVEEWWEENYG